MKNVFMNVIAISGFMLFLSLTTYPEENNQIKCISSSRTITIDGLGAEWKDNRSSVINADTAVGCYKDEDFLYIHLLTSDPELSMQLMNFGLTIWLDPKGSMKKMLGVQFPVIELQPPPPREEGGGKPPRGTELKKFLKKRLKNIIIEFPEDRDMKQMRMAKANKLGIDAKIGVDEIKSEICYELKYPLRKSSSADTMGIDLKGQKHLDICIETPELNPSELSEKYRKPQGPPDGGNAQATADREPRPPKTSKEPKPPKPSRKPLTGRIFQWIRASF